MSRAESLWERLVNAALRREITGGVSGGQQGSIVGYDAIDAILRAADEIEDEDPSIARILCEHGYSLAQNLDPNGEGRCVLQFKSGLMLVIKQKIAKKEVGTIDRRQDNLRLQEFYRLYREKNNVDRLRVLATLKVLGSVFLQLAKEVPEELKHAIDSDAAVSEDTIAYNIIPLDTPVKTKATIAFPENMSRAESLWERLVNAALRRDRTEGVSGGQQGSIVGYDSIDAILRAADEMQDENPNIARILCEHGYSLAQSLDPNSEGSCVLQFKTGLILDIKQKIAKREVGTIDRSQDILRLQEFYRLYKEKNNVDRLERETVKRKRVFAILKVLESVLVQLTKEIPEKLKNVIDSDAAVSEDTTAYNIIPLDAPVTTNATTAFPERMSQAESLWERLVNAALRRDRTGGVGGDQQGNIVIREGQSTKGYNGK